VSADGNNHIPAVLLIQRTTKIFEGHFEQLTTKNSEAKKILKKLLKLYGFAILRVFTEI
jgi:hypothetical protein